MRNVWLKRHRPVLLLAGAVVCAALAVLLGHGPVPSRTTAVGDLTGITCTEIYLDVAPLQTVGQPPGPEDVLGGMSLDRIEPSQSRSGAWDITSVTYMGPDVKSGDEPATDPLDITPDKPPSVRNCQQTGDDGNNEKENGEMNEDISFVNQFENRPTAVMTLAGSTLSYKTCVFSESLRVWIRSDTSRVITTKAPKGSNYGRSTTYFGTSAPSATRPGKPGIALDPETCSTAGALSFSRVLISYWRDATTDHPDLSKNDPLINLGLVSVDPDGCNPVYGHVINKSAGGATTSPCDPKPKGAQDQDGDNEQFVGPFSGGDPPHTSPFLADDWDGDGCPDWDELDHQFIVSFTSPNSTNQNGLDPFNPHDCTQAVNISGIYRLSLVAAHAHWQSGAPVAGAYYYCLADIQQSGKNLTSRLYCYVDIPGIPVNDQHMPGVSGDGFENGPPPFQARNPAGAPETGGQCFNNKDDDSDFRADDGCPALYGDVDSAHTVLMGTLDNNTNLIHYTGCFRDLDGHGGQGNIYMDTTQDAHTGQGTASLYINQAANCTGSPTGSPLTVEVHTVKVGEKGPCTKPEPKCDPALSGMDTDGDSCPDKKELSDTPTSGGLRDPWNPYDFFDVIGTGHQILVPDILAVVQQYFIDDLPGPIDYTSKTDRTAIVGANSWNLGPPDGLQRVPDILAVLKQYFHECS